jgi:hypothetical protein
MSERPAKIETKVKVASLATFIGVTALLALLEWVGADPNLLTVLPDWLEAPLIAAIPTFITWLAAVRAKHTPRPDLPMSER